MKMEQTECSETLTTKPHTPENIPKENIRHSKHGESQIKKDSGNYTVTSFIRRTLLEVLLHFSN
jgi:hypothetical protein